MADRVPIHGSQPVHPSGATETDRLHPETRYQVTVVLVPEKLPPDHPVARKAGAQESSWPTQRPELTVTELTALYSPPEGVVKEVVDFARQHSLDPVEVSPVRHHVILEGTAPAFDEAFQVVQKLFSHEHGTYRAHKEPIHLPESLEDSVVGVLGLDNLLRARAHAAFDLEAAGDPLPPAWLAEHYRFPQVDGLDGIRIALLEFGGGLWPGDVTAFLEEHGIPRGPIRLTEVLDGEASCPGNSPCSIEEARAIMADWRGGKPLQALFQEHPSASDFYQSLEVTLDTEIVSALAPGVSADLYFASSGADGWRRAIFAAIGLPYRGSLAAAPAGGWAGLPTALSISWGFQEHCLGPMKMRILDMALTLATQRGVSVVCSSGDRGSRMGGGPQDLLGVEFPASSPASLACGGTSLGFGQDGAVSEVAWRQELLGAEMASGGGMSGYFPTPSFQSSISPPDPSGTWLAKEGSPFAGRWVPDVSALASFSPGFELRVAGEVFSGGGTSAATPIWAALIARLSAALGGRLGRVAPALYRLSGTEALRSIERGDNDLCPRSSGPPQYAAASGWDPCTGLGVPDGEALLEALRKGPPEGG